jgi:general secretion pathway protein M
MGNEQSSLQRWLALGLLIVVLGVVIGVLVLPLISQGLDYQEQKQALSFRLKKMQQIAANKDHVAEQVARLQQQFDALHYFSRHQTKALASAELQKFVKNAIDDAGGQLTSTQVMPAQQNEGLSEIRVKVRMTGDIEVLHEVLHQIETSIPLKLIRQLEIRPLRGKRNRKTRKIEPSDQLNINFQVVAFMRQEDV